MSWLNAGSFIIRSPSPIPHFFFKTCSRLLTTTTLLAPDVACGIVEYYNGGDIALGVLSIVVGVVFGLFGYRLFIWTIFLSGAVFAGFLTEFILQARVNDSDNGSSDVIAHLHPGWVALIALVVGVLCGLVCVSFHRIGLFLCGLTSGAVLGAMLLSLRQGGLVEGEAAEWAIVGTLSIVMAVLILALQKPFTCASTSLLGAFGVTSAIDYFSNCQLFSGILKTMIQEGSLNPIRVEGGVWNWMLFVGTLLLATLGLLAQVLYTARNYRHRRTRLRSLFSSIRRFFSKRGCCCKLFRRGRPSIDADDEDDEDDDGGKQKYNYIPS